MRRALALAPLALFVGACMLPDLEGFSGGVADAGPSDGAVDAVDAADASPPRCKTDAPFTSLAPVSVSGMASEYAATLSPDELQIWYGRDGKVWHATRSKRTEPFSAPFAITLTNDGSEADPMVTADGQTMLFIHAPPNADWDIWLATKDSSGSFGSARLESAISSASTTEVLPFATKNRERLYFSGNLGGTGMDVYVASASGSDYASPKRVDELSSTGDEIGAIVSDDELTVYVASSRTDLGAKGKLDVLRATRTSSAAPFGPLTNVAELNTAADDRVTWISPDACRVYFDATRSGGSGASDIWVAERFP